MFEDLKRSCTVLLAFFKGSNQSMVTITLPFYKIVLCLNQEHQYLKTCCEHLLFFIVICPVPTTPGFENSSMWFQEELPCSYIPPYPTAQFTGSAVAPKQSLVNCSLPIKHAQCFQMVLEKWGKWWVAKSRRQMATIFPITWKTTYKNRSKSKKMRDRKP